MNEKEIALKALGAYKGGTMLVKDSAKEEFAFYWNQLPEQYHRLVEIMCYDPISINHIPLTSFYAERVRLSIVRAIAQGVEIA